MQHNSAEYLHTLIEAIQLAFADSSHYVADPSMANVPVKDLISKRYAEKRRSHIHKDRFVLPFCTYLYALDYSGPRMLNVLTSVLHHI